MKLWQKIFLAVLSLMVLCTASVSILLLRSSVNVLWQREFERAAVQTQYLAGMLKSSVINTRLQMGRVRLDEEGTENAAVQTIRNQPADSYLQGVRLLDEEGSVIADTVQNIVSDVFPSAEGTETESMLHEENGKWYILVTMPFTMESFPFDLEAVYDVTDLVGQMEQETSATVLRTIVISTCLAAVLLLMVRLLLRRLKELDQSAKSIADGSYDQRVSEKGEDELASLARDMNRLAEAVEKRIRQLEQVAEDRRIFIGNLAHEMKTPLTSILGYADLLYLSESIPEEKRIEYASIISEEAKRMRSLSAKLLELTVLGETSIEQKEVALKILTDEVKLSLSPLLQKDGITLSIRCDDVLIMADAALFKSLLYNLLDNARKASGRNDVIEMSCFREKKEAVIRIKDHGCGMEEAELEKIFRPFYMVDKSRSRKRGGAGLGLALCEQIIRLHHGHIRMTSRPGEGTEAEMRFPAVQERRNEK